MADFVFIAEVTTLTDTVKYSNITETYKPVVTIKQVFKGDVRPNHRMLILSKFERCDHSYSLGDEWLFYLIKEDDGPYAMYCPTSRVESCKKQIKLLNKIKDAE